MSTRSAMRNALATVIGDDQVRRLSAVERRWRRTLARRIEPPLAPRRRPPTRPATRTGLAERPRSRPAGGTGRNPKARRQATPKSTFPDPTRSRHELLAGLHAALAPRTYLEIGVSDGRSLAISSTRSIGVDPAFKVTAPIACDLRLVRATSDDFFALPDAIEHFGGTPVDLAFIDGLHLAEFAYRDFINVERLCGPTSVIVLDDMLPRSTAEAARVQCRGAWAGDVFKAVEVIRSRRSDLAVIPVNTRPTGVVVVIGVDPLSTALADCYDDVLPALTAGDPQTVPDHVLSRTGAADPAALAASPVWAELRALRDGAGGGPDRHAVAATIAGAGLGGFGD
ncbi:MAG: class I SAM-dependent methyltransferase [Actinomycetota bacterium]|nr:class I SAM-dependent methyltransferase [Actinomycetota bacterium]